MKLKDFLCKSDRKALQRAGDMQQVMVTYQFSALPQALQAAIPRNYAGPLFEKSDNDGASQSAQEDTRNTSSQQPPASSTSEQWESDEQRNALIEHGRKVTVVGVTIHPDKKQTYIIAGNYIKEEYW